MIEDFIKPLDAEVYKGVMGKNITAYKLGGRVDYLVKPKTAYDFISFIETFNRLGISYTVLGRGSKMLISDDGYHGVMLSTAFLNDICYENGFIIAGAGVTVGELLSFCVVNGLTGLEFLAGIPASVGGLTAVNGGAFNKSIAEITEYANVYRGGKVISLAPKKEDFGYRKSFIKPLDVVLSVALRVDKASQEAVKNNVKNNLKKRSSQPKGRSCGSVFVNPEGDYAGRLIEACQLKGYKIGGACISSKHANFFLADDNALAGDVYKLIQTAKTAVYNKFKIALKEEVILIGDFI